MRFLSMREKRDKRDKFQESLGNTGGDDYESFRTALARIGGDGS